MTEKKKRDYKVGYGKPPRHSKWKPGQSGNPKGKPKGRKNMRTILSDVLESMVTITENGKSRRVKFLQALAHQMAAKALNGSPRDQIAILKAINDYIPEALNEPEYPKQIVVEYVMPKGHTVADYDQTYEESQNEDSKS